MAGRRRGRKCEDAFQHDGGNRWFDGGGCCGGRTQDRGCGWQPGIEGVLQDGTGQQQLEDFSAERDKLLADHRKLKQEFESLRAEAQNKALTEEARDRKSEQAEDKLTEVIEYENTIREKAASRKKQIEGEGRKIHSELAKAVKSAVQACAAKGGYGLVLESGGLLANGLEPVLYASPAMDITDQVIQLLNAGKPESKE